VDSAANNHQRFVRAQFTRELRFPKYEQNDWVRCQAYNELDWFELLGFWLAYNLAPAFTPGFRDRSHHLLSRRFCGDFGSANAVAAGFAMGADHPA
jgi:hypothetical protein